MTSLALLRLLTGKKQVGMTTPYPACLMKRSRYNKLVLLRQAADSIAAAIQEHRSSRSLPARCGGGISCSIASLTDRLGAISSTPILSNDTVTLPSSLLPVAHEQNTTTHTATPNFIPTNEGIPNKMIPTKFYTYHAQLTFFLSKAKSVSMALLFS